MDAREQGQFAMRAVAGLWAAARRRAFEEEDAMRIVCDERGWHVVAEWHGEDRTVFRPTNADPIKQLRCCQEYVEMI